MTEQKQKERVVKVPSGKTYGDVAAQLARLPKFEASIQSSQRMKLLDELCASPSKFFDIITVGGVGGRSLTMHFTAKLLAEENFKVGICYASGLLTHTERIVVNNEQIPAKDFTTLAGKILDLIEARKIKASEYEVILAVAMLYFKSQNVDVALIGTGIGGKLDCTAAFNPVVMALTKVSNNLIASPNEAELDDQAFEIMGAAKANCWFVSAEQSKIRLQKMKKFAEENKFNWAMPIRKLAPLPYIFELLYGKHASLAERISQIYCEEVKHKFSSFLRGNLLSTQKGQRGRPTLEAKREAEINPVKTLKSFWANQFDLLRGQFELLDKEKPSVLLDVSSTQEALANLFLGIRLLQYRRHIKGFAIILALKATVDAAEALRQLRYLLKKIQGEVFFISLPGVDLHKPHELAQKARELNIRANVYMSLQEAFDAAKLIVDERDGLLCIAGCKEAVVDYWKNIREIKKL